MWCATTARRHGGGTALLACAIAAFLPGRTPVRATAAESSAAQELVRTVAT
ncbi:hypothetical protein JOF53_008200 [Crossiella equi]|uniref:Uncharacterized protein n=1 Tax=Crossiella equi TaxID=130796 RepID=A0ABS5ARZ5_9PSEU|nr:hypothetical protein [Crossiella equi]MBP2479328.1 hypothetical protein [Crossiella equi]